MSQYILDAITEAASDEAVTDAMETIKTELKNKLIKCKKELKKDGDSRWFPDEIEESIKALSNLAYALEDVSNIDAEIFDPHSEEF